VIRIEPARDADRPTLVAFAEAIQDFERETNPNLHPGEVIARAYTAWMTGEVKANGGIILIARDDQTPAGFVCAWPAIDDDQLVKPEARAHAYVSDLYVAPQYRRQGLASSLLEAAEAEMAGRGCTRLRICAKASNQAALGCYAGFGFIPYEVILEKPISPA
jgi:ribosomal protein S18 acetylase RimI-like enzyme